MELQPLVNGLMGSPCWLALSFRRGKNKWLWAVLKLLAICKWLSSNSWSISLLLFPENITHIIIQHIAWEKLSLLQRGSEAKCIWKLPGHTEMREDSYLAPLFFFILHWCVNYQSIKYFLFFLLCCLPCRKSNDTFNRCRKHLKMKANSNVIL